MFSFTYIAILCLVHYIKDRMQPWISHRSLCEARKLYMGCNMYWYRKRPDEYKGYFVYSCGLKSFASDQHLPGDQFPLKIDKQGIDKGFP